MALLELKAITKDFPGVRALDGVSFDLQKGEIHALCGENGAGKSTLIKVLCGYHPFGTYQGEIFLRDKPVRFHDLKDSEKAGIALIAQELAMVPELSVAENLMLGKEPSKNGLIQWDTVRARAQEALNLVDLKVALEQPVKELGIGQQQMIEIAKALSKKAEILVLDEPTAALSESDTARLLDFLRQLKSQGVSCVYISHRIEEVRQIADRVTVLRDGKSVITAPLDQMSQDKIISHMVGRKVESLYPRPQTRAGATLLKVENLRVEDPANPGRYVVEDVSFEVKQGEILGIGGLMGAGRTAVLSALFGAARSRVSGLLEVDGQKREIFTSPQEAIAEGVALVSEDRKKYGLVMSSSVEQNLVLAVLKKLVSNGFINWSAVEKTCAEQVETLRIKAPGLDALVEKLSGGNQQKVILGKWLASRPKVLLLDEPTRGIDVGAKAEIYELMGRLAGEGLGIVLVSSDLPEFLSLCHRMIVLNQGRLTAKFDYREATPEKVLAAAAL